MKARYLIRLDDACDTMDHVRWASLENVLDRYSVKPIVAVVPDNRDPSLAVSARDASFWDKVRAWAAKGWTIAMHGHTHAMAPTDSPLLVPFYQRSEFAGLTLEQQSRKIRAAWELFAANSVVPTVWVAPAHSFDAVTLEALRNETPIRVVSDGIAFNTYCEHGFQWIPQQLWGLAPHSWGLWTVCLHPNGMSAAQIAALEGALAGPFRQSMIGVRDVALPVRRKGLAGRLYHEYFWWRWRNRRSAPV